MSKEKIMEEFDSEWIKDWINNKTNNQVRWTLKKFVSKVYDQVRLETIKEVEEMLPNEREIGLSGCTECSDYTNSFNDCLNQIKDSLNKLK